MTDTMNQVESAELPLITASRLRSFETCKRLHHHTYVEGWRPRVVGEALRFGTLFHAGLEAWWGWHRSAEIEPEMIGHDVAFEPLTEALNAVAGRGVDAYEQAKVEEVLTGYDMRWRSEADRYEVLGVEVEFRAPLLNPATMAASRTWRLGGKIDALARRRDDGHVLVIEHKGTIEEIESDADHYWSTLALDVQLSGYVIGAEALGYAVDECLYDVAKRPGQKPYKATAPESRKFTKDGRLYANQREFDETPDEYRARLREEIQGNLTRYFQRRAIPRTQSQIRDYLADTWASARTMHEMNLAGFAPRNPAACFRMGQCPLWLVCSTGSHPSSFPSDYYQPGTANPELSR